MFGIAFSNPAILHGLWFALLPIAIHLFNRRRMVTVAFSNVSLLHSLEYDRMRRVRLKQIFLLFLRTLLIILIVIGFARPTLQGAQVGSRENARTLAVLVLDRSLSMGYHTEKGTLFEGAIRRIQETLNLFDVRDEVSLILMDDRVEEFNPGSLSLLKQQVNFLQPTFRNTDLKLTLESVLNIVNQSEMLNREFYLFTDLGRNGWIDFPDSLMKFEGITGFLVPERPSRLNNLGVRRFRNIQQILSVGSPVSLEIELANYGEEFFSGLPVKIYLEERPISQKIIPLSGKMSHQIFVDVITELKGPNVLKVEIEKDALEADNTYTLVVNVPDQLNTLLVSEALEETYYIERALSVSLSTKGKVIVNHVFPSELTSKTLAEADVILLCNISQLSTSHLNALKKRVEEGAGLVITLGNRVDFQHYNSRLLPTLFPSSLIEIVGNPGETKTFNTLQEPLPDHPLFQSINPENQFKSPYFYVYYSVHLGSESHTVVRLKNGAEILAEGRLGTGRVALFSSSLETNLKWTDFPINGFFVPFVHQLFHYVSPDASRNSNYAIGEKVFREIREDKAKRGLVKTPTGQERTIWPEYRGTRKIWSVGEVDIPGLWEIYAQEQLIDRFAVNPAAQECDLTPVPPVRLREILDGGKIQLVEPDAILTDVVLKRRYGRELWRIVLGLVLVLMVIETLVIRSVKTDRKKTWPIVT